MLVGRSPLELHLTLRTGYNGFRANLVMRLLVFPLHRLFTSKARDHGLRTVLIMLCLVLAEEDSRTLRTRDARLQADFLVHRFRLSQERFLTQLASYRHLRTFKPVVILCLHHQHLAASLRTLSLDRLAIMISQLLKLQ